MLVFLDQKTCKNSLEMRLFIFCNADGNWQMEKGQRLISLTVLFSDFKYKFWNVCFADCTLNVPKVKELRYQISCLQYSKLLHVIYKTGFVGFINRLQETRRFSIRLYYLFVYVMWLLYISLALMNRVSTKKIRLRTNTFEFNLTR